VAEQAVQVGVRVRTSQLPGGKAGVGRDEVAHPTAHRVTRPAFTIAPAPCRQDWVKQYLAQGPTILSVYGDMLQDCECRLLRLARGEWRTALGRRAVGSGLAVGWWAVGQLAKV